MDWHGLDDTIAAISTPPGRGGIGILRLSGPRALAIAQSVLRLSHGRQLASMAPFSAAHGWVMQGDGPVDEIIATVMRAPRSYTTQDVVEINCHGGPVPLRRALELVLAGGARLADPGEFTKRAYAFGRIDLAQAEAVLDVVNAQTEAACAAALSQLAGGLSARIAALRSDLLDVMAGLEAAIDFGEEDPGAPRFTELCERCAALRSRVDDLLQTAKAGQVLRDGLRVAIAGRPNVGKSSLMNALLGRERVIVTPVPGTTRDTVEDALAIAGVPIVLTDTAGLRQTVDPAEAQGVARTQAALGQADLVLAVVDGSEPLREEDRALFEGLSPERSVLCLNKCDKPAAWEPGLLAGRAWAGLVTISALRGDGLDILRQTIGELALGGIERTTEDVLVTNVRHRLALERAAGALDRALERAAEGLTEEYVSEELRAGLDALGQVVGATVSQDLVDRIFDAFCIGK